MSDVGFIKTEGMTKLINKLDRMSKAPAKVVDKALQEAGEHVKKVEVKVVKQTHDKWSENVGYKEIQTFKIKARRNGSKIIQIGVRGSQKGTPTKSKKGKSSKSGTSRPRNNHWNKIRGLWFNNYGFYHNKTGKYVAGSNWIGKSYEQSKKRAYQIIEETILKEMNLDE